MILDLIFYHPNEGKETRIFFILYIKFYGRSNIFLFIKSLSLLIRITLNFSFMDSSMSGKKTVGRDRFLLWWQKSSLTLPPSNSFSFYFLFFFLILLEHNGFILALIHNVLSVTFEELWIFFFVHST